MKNTTEKSLLGKIQLFDRTGGITREVCNVCLPGSSLFLFVVWDGDLFEVSDKGDGSLAALYVAFFC